MGFTVKLLKTKDVKTYAKVRQKNDYNDALAIAKAAKDPELRLVVGKSKEVQDITLIHKTRKNTIRDRIQKTNSMMSSLYEYGYVTELSKSKFCKSCKNEVEQAHEEGYISEQAYKILLIDCKEIEELCKKEKS